MLELIYKQWNKKKKKHFLMPILSLLLPAAVGIAEAVSSLFSFCTTVC